MPEVIKIVKKIENPKVSKKILIVDDEVDIRELFKEVLSEAGFNVDVAGSGRQCLIKVQRNKYDLVLLDMFMPAMSGRETFEKILLDSTQQNIKVAFLTVADAGKTGESELQSMGAVAYIRKPIDNKSLIAKITDILSK